MTCEICGRERGHMNDEAYGTCARAALEHFYGDESPIRSDCYRLGFEREKDARLAAVASQHRSEEERVRAVAACLAAEKSLAEERAKHEEDLVTGQREQDALTERTEKADAEREKANEVANAHLRRAVNAERERDEARADSFYASLEDERRMRFAAEARVAELETLLREARDFVALQWARNPIEFNADAVARIDAALAKPQDAPPNAPRFGHCIGEQWTAGYDAALHDVDRNQRGEARVFWCDTKNDRHSCYCPKSPRYIEPQKGARLLAEADALISKYTPTTEGPAGGGGGDAGTPLPAAEQGRKPLTICPTCRLVVEYNMHRHALIKNIGPEGDFAWLCSVPENERAPRIGPPPEEGG